jgi:hypothetical protein
MTAQPVNIPPTGQPIPVWMGNSNAPPILIINPDISNTVWVNWSTAGPNLAIGGPNSIPLGPGQSVVIPGTQTIYVIGTPGTAATIVIPGGTAFFQPTTASAIGAVQVFVQAATPTGVIPLNSIWIDTTNGSINNWNGTIWVQQEFNASNLIQAGTIVASLIEANTITAALLAAGIVYAGIIDGTTVNAATFNGSTFNGTNFTINADGAFFYSAAPAANNLILSVCTIVGFVDPYGNNILSGTTSYTPVSGGYAATQVNGVTFAVYLAATMTGAFPWSQAGVLSYNDSATPTVVLQSSVVPLQVGSVNSYLNLFGAGCLLFGLTPPASAIGTYLFVNSITSNAALQSYFGYQGIIPITNVDAGIAATGNVTAFTDITHKVTLESTLVPNSRWTLRVNFTGTWGLQVMSIGADINGTVTNLGGLAAAFATGAASGDSITGWIELEFYIVTTIACRISCKGYVHDNTVAANNSDTAGSGIATTVATGVTIAGGDTIAIAIKFAASVAAQTITPDFDSVIRDGA